MKINIFSFTPVFSCSCSLKEVWLGTHSLSKQEKDSRQVIQVQRSVPHPCYDTTEKVNDLMLLKVTSHESNYLTNNNASCC